VFVLLFLGHFRLIQQDRGPQTARGKYIPPFAFPEYLPLVNLFAIPVNPIWSLVWQLPTQCAVLIAAAAAAAAAAAVSIRRQWRCLGSDLEGEGGGAERGVTVCENGVLKPWLYSHIQMIILPRQARDKRRENSKNSVFSQALYDLLLLGAAGPRQANPRCAWRPGLQSVAGACLLACLCAACLRLTERMDGYDESASSCSRAESSPAQSALIRLRFDLCVTLTKCTLARHCTFRTLRPCAARQWTQ
jgi:hypothetical protein